MSMISEIRQSFREADVTIRLVYLNVFVFVVIRLSDLTTLFGFGEREWLVSWLAMPVGSGILYRPWTPLTYMVSHYDFIHFFFNMIGLYWFGRIFMTVFADGRKALLTYVAGGLVGGAAAFLSPLFVGAGNMVLIGASGAIMALLFAVTFSAPNLRLWLTLIGHVRLKYVALVYFLLDVLSISAFSNVGGHLAHIGGALAGMVLVALWRRGILTKGLPWPSLRRSHIKVVHKSDNIDWDFNKQKNDRNKEMDRLLEKIKLSGYDSLSQDEKRTLFDMSKN